MRAQYLSSDRPDFQIECRDLARKMQQPSNLDEMGLKRLARFLGVRPRLVCSSSRIVLHESNPGAIQTMQAASELGRVSGCAMMMGGSTFSTYCKGQAVIALSPCEGKYYGLVSATSQMLGLQSILLDWGWKFNAHVWMDATAGIAIGSRRGLGRVKDIDTVFFWVQTMVTESKISLGKKPTKEMLADFLTKHVDASTVQSCFAGLGMTLQSSEGRLTLLMCGDVETGYRWFWELRCDSAIHVLVEFDFPCSSEFSCG